MTNTNLIKNSTVFVNWQALFTTLNYFISTPKINVSSKQLIAKNLGVIIGSLISNILKSNESQLISRLEKRIKREDIERFIKYFKSPVIQKVNNELLDIIICPENDHTLPFALIELAFESVNDIINLERWAIVDYEKDSIDYDYIIHNIERQNMLYNLDEGNIDSGMFNEFLMQVFNEELIRFSIERSDLSLLMPYLYRLRYDESVNIDKTEDSNQIMINIISNTDNISHHWIEQIYPFSNPSIKDFIMPPNIEEFNLNIRNEAYMKHFPNKEEKMFEIRMGYLVGDIHILKNSLVVMASNITDIKVTSKNPKSLKITIEKKNK